MYLFSSFLSLRLYGTIYFRRTEKKIELLHGPKVTFCPSVIHQHVPVRASASKHRIATGSDTPADSMAGFPLTRIEKSIRGLVTCANSTCLWRHLMPSDRLLNGFVKMWQ
jgi:hypothetical protein